MNFSFAGLLVVVGLFHSDAQECFCDKELGCFDNGPPWSSLPWPVPCPWTPEKIRTKFTLYTEFGDAYVIPHRPEITLEGSSFDASKETVVVIHGYNGKAFSDWQYDLMEVLVKLGFNVIVIDWSQGSGTSIVQYLQAALNTRIVAAELARLLKYLIKLGQLPTDIYCVGHSLGAHICGYAAKKLRELSRIIAAIIGLDVAGPIFRELPTKWRVARRDAIRFIALYTDAMETIPCAGFGMVEPQGDLNLYMNGGLNQPSCDYINALNNISYSDIFKTPENVMKIRACSHKKVTDYFVAAVKNKHCMTGKRITNLLPIRINSVICTKLIPVESDVVSCSKDSCVPVGWEMINSNITGSFVAKALGHDPYCSELS